MTLAFRLALRILSILLGVVIALCAIEGALRLAGWMILTAQDRANRRGLGDADTIVVAAIGESTTQGGNQGDGRDLSSYPAELQALLDRSGSGHRFKVVNLGIGGTNTREILKSLPANLDYFHPRIVVTMMGINDGEGTRLSHKLSDYVEFIEAEAAVAAKGEPAAIPHLRSPGFDWTRLRTYKLIDWIWRALKARYLHGSPYYIPKGEFERAAHPRVGKPWGGAPALRGDDADANFDRVMSGVKADDMSYFTNLHFIVADVQHRYHDAERMHREVIAKYPDHRAAHYALGETLLGESRKEEAIVFLREAFRLDPGYSNGCRDFGLVLVETQRWEEAETVLERCLADVDSPDLYQALRRALAAQGRDDRVESVLRKEIAVYPGDAVPHEQLAELYRRHGRAEDAAREEAEAARAAALIHPATYFHYRALARELRRRGIRLVAMQYPTRSIAPLHRILDDVDSDIRFVENRDNFRRALATLPYEALFLDRFAAGDFGHCTRLGNRMIAENLLPTILDLAEHLPPR